MIAKTNSRTKKGHLPNAQGVYTVPDVVRTYSGKTWEVRFSFVELDSGEILGAYDFKYNGGGSITPIRAETPPQVTLDYLEYKLCLAVMEKAPETIKEELFKTVIGGKLVSVAAKVKEGPAPKYVKTSAIMFGNTVEVYTSTSRIRFAKPVSVECVKEIEIMGYTMYVIKSIDDNNKYTVIEKETGFSPCAEDFSTPEKAVVHAVHRIRTATRGHTEVMRRVVENGKKVLVLSETMFLHTHLPFFNTIA